MFRENERKSLVSTKPNRPSRGYLLGQFLVTCFGFVLTKDDLLCSLNIKDGISFSGLHPTSFAASKTFGGPERTAFGFVFDFECPKSSRRPRGRLLFATWHSDDVDVP